MKEEASFYRYIVNYRKSEGVATPLKVCRCSKCHEKVSVGHFVDEYREALQSFYSFLIYAGTDLF